MNSATFRRVARFGLSAAAVFVFFALSTSSAHAQGKKKNPTSKVYVADVNGDAQIDTGVQIDDLNKKSVYNAQGSVIETKPNATNAMVYSNGTGIFFDADTRVEVKKFSQEPFAPTRNDQEVEPSISQTHAFVARGSVGLCNSKLVAGSNMTYQTPLGSVAIRGKKIVVESADNVTKISMIEGESTVRGGNLDLGGHTLKSGEQAVIRPGPPGQPNIVEIQPIPQNEAAALDDKVSLACMAKKTVYFETRDKTQDKKDTADEPVPETTTSSGEKEAPKGDDAAKKTDDPVAPGTSSNTSTESPFGSPSAPVSAFDGNSAAPSMGPNIPTRVGGVTVSDGVIVAVPVVPASTPVTEVPISASELLPTPRRTL